MTTQVQDHIHLSLTLGDAPELAPNHTWRVKYGTLSEIPKVYVTVDEAINGAIQLQQLLDEDGEVVNKLDRTMTLLCADDDEESLDADDRKLLLFSMHGKRVKFVPHKHPDNGEDHTAKIQPSILFIGGVPEFDPLLTRWYVPVQILDDHIS